MRKVAVKGFTLVELMVAVGILAVLAAVAVPMYGSHVKNARANEGQAVLSLIKAKQEVYRASRFTYASDLKDLPGFSDTQESHGDYFYVTIVSGDRNSFVVRAWDGQQGISGTAGGEEWYITNTLDEPCRTKSSLYDNSDDPCIETVKAALQ